MPVPSPQSLLHWRYWDLFVPIWYDAEFRLPLTAFGKHWGLEPRRADLVVWYLLEKKWIAPANLRAPARARYEDLARVHAPAYLEQLTSRETLARIFGVDPVGRARRRGHAVRYGWASARRSRLPVRAWRGAVPP